MLVALSRRIAIATCRPTLQDQIQEVLADEESSSNPVGPIGDCLRSTTKQLCLHPSKYDCMVSSYCNILYGPLARDVAILIDQVTAEVMTTVDQTPVDISKIHCPSCAWAIRAVGDTHLLEKEEDTDFIFIKEDTTDCDPSLAAAVESFQPTGRWASAIRGTQGDWRVVHCAFVNRMRDTVSLTGIVCYTRCNLRTRCREAAIGAHPHPSTH